MRIGFDVTPLCAPQSGVGTYTSNLLEHLHGQNGRAGDQILPLAHRRPWVDRMPAFHGRPLGLNKTVWMQAVLPWQLTGLRAEVCHLTNSTGPLWTACPTVVTIHDMTLWLFPECHNRGRLLTMRPIIPIVARRAKAIIAVSCSAKRDITRILGVPEHKVHVISEAAAPSFGPLPTGAADAVRRRRHLPERFMLHVGTLEPRKNLVRLIQAFARLRRDGLRSHSLVLAGSRGWRDSAVFAAVERLALADAVHFLGYVPTETLVALYNLADVLVYPSLYEGFGLPVVEAMACGTPVVTSANGALRETAGDAAEFFEPTDVPSIAAGLERVLCDPARGEELRAKGLAQAARFSWVTAAVRTRQVYARVAAGRVGTPNGAASG